MKIKIKQLNKVSLIFSRWALNMSLSRSQNVCMVNLANHMYTIFYYSMNRFVQITPFEFLAFVILRDQKVQISWKQYSLFINHIFIFQAITGHTANKMKVYEISAITLRIMKMDRSCHFYSQIPGFRLVYGGSVNDMFSTYEIGDSNSSKVYLNLELIHQTYDQNIQYDHIIAAARTHFGRIIFHTDDVDKLYDYFKNNESISTEVIFENAPTDAPWGERYFHIREPDGYQLSFATCITSSNSSN